MSRALLLAHQCTKAGDVPVGAVVLDGRGNIIGKGWNRRVAADDPTAHAEIEALRQAGREVGTWNLTGCTLISTLEPCTMCAGAAVNARISRVVFGAWDAKAGACGSVRDVVRDARLNHQVEVISGLMEEDTTIQLKAFFASRRSAKENPHSDFWAGKSPSAKKPDTPEKPRPARDAVLPEAKQKAAKDKPKVLPKDSSKPAPKPVVKSERKPDPKPERTPDPKPVDTGTVPPVRRRSDRHIGRVVVPPLDDAAW
jgi:Cytosine/adenosine deaminases